MSGRAELRLLLALALRETPAGLPDKVDFAALLRAGLAHGVAPLLWLRLKDAPGLPGDARDSLKSLYKQNLAHAARLSQEQRRVLALLAARGIGARALKGTDLALRLYGDIAARQVADIDLLIAPEELAACDSALEGAGYERQAPGGIALYTGAQELLYIRRDSDATFAVDLHQRLLPYAREDSLAKEVRAWGLTPALLLLYLCVNQVTHRFSRLKYLADVVQQIRTAAGQAGGAFDWREFVRVARGLEVWPGVTYSLEMAREAAQLAEIGGGVEIPAEVLRTLDPGAREREKFLVLRGATPIEWLERCGKFNGAAGARIAIRCTQPGMSRARLALRLAIPPASYMRQEYRVTPGRWLLPVYVGRLAGKLAAAGASKPDLSAGETPGKMPTQ